ncbi:MAG TPA: hypothetical protein VIL86_06135 [Tepidisphaeraceae bacterium]
MVKELLILLPKDPARWALAAGVGGTLIGAGLWLCGSRFSRGIVTLLAVLVGAIVGMLLPRWCGWGISGAGPAVGGAIVLGIAGYGLHRMWIGLGLGGTLAVWAALGCWVTLGAGCQIDWSAIADGGWGGWWAGLPGDLTRVLPFACAGALVSGLAAALLWPRVAVVMLYSLVGVSLMCGLGLAAVQWGRPGWIAMLPAENWAQATVLLGLTALGAVVQWRLGAGAGSGKVQESDASSPST